MNDTELTQLVQAVSLQYFHKPFLHTACFNTRLQTTGGRYHLKDHHLDFNPKFLQFYPKETFVAIIKHELCHYHLHLAGQPYQHRSQAFKTLLAQVGGLRYAPVLPKATRSPKKLEIYRCGSCGQIYQRRRKINLQRYACGKCGGRLTFIETIEQIE